MTMWSTTKPSARIRFRGVVSLLRFLGGGALLALVGCSAVILGDHGTGGSPTIVTIPESIARSASAVCDETRLQLDRLQGSEEVLVGFCGAARTENEEIHWEIGLNDHAEWGRLIATNTTEEVLFTIPLALVAYGFAGSAEEPETFDRIRIAFDNDNNTTYEFTANELSEVLRAESPAEVEAGIRRLQFQMTITSRD